MARLPPSPAASAPGRASADSQGPQAPAEPGRQEPTSRPTITSRLADRQAQPAREHRRDRRARYGRRTRRTPARTRPAARMALRPCIGCRRLIRSGSRCRDCKLRRPSGNAWRPTRTLVLARDGYRCQDCGALANVVDHITPIAHGSSEHPSNLEGSFAPRATAPKATAKRESAHSPLRTAAARACAADRRSSADARRSAHAASRSARASVRASLSCSLIVAWLTTASRTIARTSRRAAALSR